MIAPGARARAMLAALTCAVAVTACAPLPTAPDPLPATFIPEVEPSPPPPSVPVGPDGFSIVERVAMRVSVVTCEGYSNGSAWVLDEDTVVTNRHVVEGAVEIELTSYDGRHYTGTSSVLDETADLALIDIDGTFPETATIADRGPWSIDDLFVVGYPEAGRLTTTDARYLRDAPETLDDSEDPVYLLDALTKPGSSGSPVTNIDGEVVGVVYAANDTGWTYAVTLDTLMDFLDGDSARADNVADCDR